MTDAEVNAAILALEAVRGYCELTVEKTHNTGDPYLRGLRAAARDVLTLIPWRDTTSGRHAGSAGGS